MAAKPKKTTRTTKARANEPRLTHVDARGQARMVDVGSKDVTSRRAVAVARVTMAPETLARLSSGDTPKGDVLAAARLAGIGAAKRTSELIPLCHPIPLSSAKVEIDLEAPRTARVTATCEARDRTGVEMEALVAASLAALTLYDMLKAIDRGITFDVALLEKDGGKTGSFRRGERW